MDYKARLEFLCDCVREAYGEVSQAEMRVSDKGAFDNVTNFDTGIEKILIDRISARYPDDMIISEEFNSKNEYLSENGASAGGAWVIDPIDGTVNMAHGNKLFGVQCAYMYGGETQASLIYLPVFGEWFTAIKGEGAYLNGDRILVMRRDFQNAMVTLGDFSHKSELHASQQYALIERLYRVVGKLRLFGAASVDFAFLAAGRTDGMIMFTRNIWDIAPGLLIAKEAGAIIGNFEGKPYDFCRDSIVAAATQEMFDLMTGRETE